jgi:hypothetical protein
MTALRLSLMSLGGLALATASALGIARAASGRADCPGKITCSVTGEIVCRDQCPTVDPDRADCPGRIECPLTGELICVDHCPVDQQNAAITPSRPSCCKE